MRSRTSGRTTSRPTRCTSTSSPRIVNETGGLGRRSSFCPRASRACLLPRTRETLLRRAPLDAATTHVFADPSDRVLVTVDAVCLVRAPVHPPSGQRGLFIDDSQSLERLIALDLPE